MDNDKEKNIIPDKSEKPQPFTQIISAPPIDLSEAILRAGLEKNKGIPVTEILTVYKKL